MAEFVTLAVLAAWLWRERAHQQERAAVREERAADRAQATEERQATREREAEYARERQAILLRAGVEVNPAPLVPLRQYGDAAEFEIEREREYGP